MAKTNTFFKKYFIDAMSCMAYGLFASLIIGVIMGQLAKIEPLSFLGMYSELLSASSPVVGSAVAFAVGYGLKCEKFALFSLAGVGAIAYKLGGPVCCYVAACIAGEIGTLLSGKTKFDIILIPLVTLAIGGMVAKFVGAPVSQFMTFLGSIINRATYMHPVLMGIIISVIMGICLTMPISSAAIAISLNLSGIAAGAATVGCCVHMLGFAIASYRENKLGGFLAQGIGTSMLQVSNIIRHPLILFPPVIVSAILGPIATTFVTIENYSWGAGMGTSGLVGILGAYQSMIAGGEPVNLVLIKIAIMLIGAPLLLTFSVSEIFRKCKFIKNGDMKLE